MVSVQVFGDAYQFEHEPSLNGRPIRKIQALRGDLFKSNIVNKAEQVKPIKVNAAIPLRSASSVPVHTTKDQIDGQMKNQFIDQIARQQCGFEGPDGTFPQVCCFQHENVFIRFRV